MKACAEGGGEPPGAAGVVRDFGVDEDDVHGRAKVASARYLVAMDVSLNAHEARVLGVLVEKGYSTPDQYPLSLNAVANGCNQKSNRDPAVDFSEAEVRIALQGLRMKGFVGVSVPAGSRVEKYRHNGGEVLGLGDRALAVLAELLLRGPQTLSELKTRGSRMRDIPSKDVATEVIVKLMDKGYARELPGGRATRYGQLLCGELAVDAEAAVPDAPAPAASTPAQVPLASTPTPAAAPAGGGLEQRVASLERTVADLNARLAELERELGA